MPNHYHLLLETPRPTLVKGMQYLNSIYTQRYNVRHKIRGHLFQGRYKALLVEGEAQGYFLTVSDYIHLNPVRARRVRTPEELLKDPWSSAGWLSGARKDPPEWLDWERIFGELGLRKRSQHACRKYREYLEGRFGEARNNNPKWKTIRRGWCLGSESFVERMKEKLEEISKEPRERESWAGPAVEEMEEDRAAQIFEAGAKVLGCIHLAAAKRADRLLLAALAQHKTRVSFNWLAARLGGRSPAGLRSSISRFRRDIKDNSALRHQWKHLLRKLPKTTFHKKSQQISD